MRESEVIEIKFKIAECIVAYVQSAEITQCVWANHFSHTISPEAKFMCDSKVRSQQPR